jgi:hypothetical protein
MATTKKSAKKSSKKQSGCIRNGELVHGAVYDKELVVNRMVELCSSFDTIGRKTDAMYLGELWPVARNAEAACSMTDPATGSLVTARQFAADLQAKLPTWDETKVSRVRKAYRLFTDPKGQYKWPKKFGQNDDLPSESEIQDCRDVVNNSRGGGAVAKKATKKQQNKNASRSKKRGTGLIKAGESLGSRCCDAVNDGVPNISLKLLLEAVTRGFNAQLNKPVVSASKKQGRKPAAKQQTEVLSPAQVSPSELEPAMANLFAQFMKFAAKQQ